jgi:hypothetical protein
VKGVFLPSTAAQMRKYRYQKVTLITIHQLLKQILEAMFVTSNAPGRSVYNRMERKMAPLSRELFGLILHWVTA